MYLGVIIAASLIEIRRFDSVTVSRRSAKGGETHSVILLAKFVDVFVSYHVISCLRTARKKFLRILVICLEAAVLSMSIDSAAKMNWIADSVAHDMPNATASS